VRATTLKPQYVEFIPKALEDGVLYISKEFSTATHRCCCGCGSKIVTPLLPTEYHLTERGSLVSLWPSIGSWDHPCKSHYVIRENRVLWADPLSEAGIRLSRAQDEALKSAYFAKANWPWWRRTGSRLKQWFLSLGSRR
jgi:hypothetical protein